MLSAICFTLDQSKILSSGNVLITLISPRNRAQREKKLCFPRNILKNGVAKEVRSLQNL